MHLRWWLRLVGLSEKLHLASMARIRLDHHLHCDE
jgi:hypothetical protein